MRSGCPRPQELCVLSGDRGGLHVGLALCERDSVVGPSVHAPHGCWDGHLRERVGYRVSLRALVGATTHEVDRRPVTDHLASRGTQVEDSSQADHPGEFDGGSGARRVLRPACFGRRPRRPGGHRHCGRWLPPVRYRRLRVWPGSRLRRPRLPRSMDSRRRVRVCGTRCSRRPSPARRDLPRPRQGCRLRTWVPTILRERGQRCRFGVAWPAGIDPRTGRDPSRKSGVADWFRSPMWPSNALFSVPCR